MTQPWVALDVDSTLAGVCGPAFDLLKFPDEDYHTMETYHPAGVPDRAWLSAVWHVWNLRPEDIEPMEPRLAASARRLTEDCRVDVVSKFPDHYGLAESKVEWLEDHGLGDLDFRRSPFNEPKAALTEYDAFIEDAPAFPEEAKEHGDPVVFLVDRPYNRNAPGEYTRVNRIADVPNTRVYRRLIE